MTREEYIKAILDAIEHELRDIAIPRGGELPQTAARRLYYKTNHVIITAEISKGEKE